MTNQKPYLIRECCSCPMWLCVVARHMGLVYPVSICGVASYLESYLQRRPVEPRALLAEAMRTLPLAHGVLTAAHAEGGR